MSCTYSNNNIFGTCEICVSSGEQKQRKMLSLMHVNNELNKDLTANLVTVHIRGEKYDVLNMVYAGTRYGERTIET